MSKEIEEITENLMTSYKTRKPIDFIRNAYSLDEAASYEVQEAFVRKKCAEYGEEISGYKISMTSPETQALADTNEPAYGTLTTSSMIKTKARLNLEEMNAPLAEPELMFVLTDDLSSEADEEEILAKSKIAPGLEIPDSRYEDWFPNFSLVDLICDNAVTGKVVMGEPVDVPNRDDLPEVMMQLFHNGEKQGEGSGAAVLENPVSAVAWLVNKLAGRNKTLKKGMVISSGTFISPIKVKKGTYKAVFSGIGEAEVTFE
ncbi:2-keto-4-pentenoate hydratase [Virgibacillus sp. YIM 98842]|uniref:2-keto-4-pentenoate hydratase n=1 Tax=Virgibacillus sp. YIM 98842 TaxID=2663533 RepID=UPI0013D97F71|nr:2-keto-4-pentenoate hydratase [Virgibacillus sp. YIM 98842]